MQGFKYVVIGGGLAGGRACEAIRRVDKSGSVALITSELHRPYQRPPLSKGYLTGKEGLDQVFLKEESFYAENDIELVTSATAEALDPDSHTVTLAQGRAVQYEKLLLAMGGRPIRLPLPGNELGNVFVLRTIEHCEAIQAAARSSSRALIMGGSFIGCEVATALTQLGVRVTMVFPEARLLGKALSEELSGYLRGMFEQKGVRVVSGARPTALEGEGQVQRARLDNGETLDIDMVAMGVGIRLNTELAREAGLELDTRGAILVDDRLRTSNPDIYAAGDIASWPDATYGKRLRVEHWDVARQQGTRAGRNMAGEDKPYTALPYFYSDLFELSFEAWGDLSNWERTLLQGAPQEGRFALYYFAGDRLSGALVAGWSRDDTKALQARVSARPTYAEIEGEIHR
jgi:3-phenylpropionate/trans-cinnamate dioxygenase ferredoxin reductase subunit